MDRRDPHIDDLFAWPMFVVSAVFLTALAGALHLHELAGIYPYAFAACVGSMTLVYPFYVFELAWHSCAGSGRWRQHLLYCLVPPRRLKTRDIDQGNSVWLPWFGRQEIMPHLITRIDRQISLPMSVTALIMLLLMAIEFFMADWIAQHALLGLLVRAATALIWTAFAAEFIIIISIVDEFGTLPRPLDRPPIPIF